MIFSRIQSPPSAAAKDNHASPGGSPQGKKSWYEQSNDCESISSSSEMEHDEGGSGSLCKTPREEPRADPVSEPVAATAPTNEPSVLAVSAQTEKPGPDINSESAEEDDLLRSPMAADDELVLHDPALEHWSNAPGAAQPRHQESRQEIPAIGLFPPEQLLADETEGSGAPVE